MKKKMDPVETTMTLRNTKDHPVSNNNVPVAGNTTEEVKNIEQSVISLTLTTAEMVARAGQTRNV